MLSSMSMRTTWTLAAALGASYALPGGHVDISSSGFVELTPEDTPAMTTLHVRLALSNLSSEQPWAFDATRVTLDAGSLRERPTFVSSELPTVPIAVLDRGASTAVDLYFALPDAHIDLAGARLSWVIATGVGTLTEHTRLAAVSSEHRTSGGGHWWFDPTHEWPRFYHRDGKLVPRPPAHVLITRPPSS
jgi:hypothetical protein